MNALIHLCLSSHPEQLERWCQAFPDGRIVASLAEVAETDAAMILWMHTDFIKEQSLEQILTVIKQQFHRLRVVVISNIPTPDESLRAISSGALGYCHAQATSSLLHQVATVVDNNGLWLGAELMDRLLAAAGRVFTLQPDHAALNKLTSREKEVALAVASGKSNREIAASLDITERTVKAHLTAIFDKLDLRDRLQLVVLLRRDR